MIKTLKAILDGTHLCLIKAAYDKPTANIILNGENMKVVPLAGTRERCPLSPLVFNIVLEVLDVAVRQRNKGARIGKKKK